jgi:large subunit ribosomal protein L25
MAAKHTFVAQPRTLLGKKSKQVTAQKQIPANINGHIAQPIAISIDLIGFKKLYDLVGDTGVIYLMVNGQKEERPVLISEVQNDPMSGVPFHVTFRQVDLTEKVEAEVPVEVIGEFAIKNALLVTVHDAVTVMALPQDLPEKFVIDASKFTEVGQSVTYAQLDFDRDKVELQIEAADMETPVVLVQEIKEEVEPEVVTAPVEGEAAAPAAGASAESASAAGADKKE